MANDAADVAFAGLHSGGGQLDQAFEEVGARTIATGSMPQRFPRFMRFPVVAMVEKIDRIEELVCSRRTCVPKAVPGRIADGMRELARHVRVRRQRPRRRVTGWRVSGWFRHAVHDTLQEGGWSSREYAGSIETRSVSEG